MGVSLRPYQKDAVEAVLRDMNGGIRRQLISLPTGAGKTIVGTEVARRLGGRTVFLVHTDELVGQTIGKFRDAWPEVKVGVVKADRDEAGAHVVVASVQTLVRPGRVERILGGGPVDLLVTDEAHHSASESWTKVIRGLGFLPEARVNSLLLGMTATPFRADGLGLDSTFQKVTYRAWLVGLIREGYLADVRAYRLETALDLSQVRTTAGDFNEKDLALAVNTPRRNKAVVAGYQRYAAGRKAVAFAVDVQHAHDLAQTFAANGVPAETVWGDMPKRDRDAAIQRFRTGELLVLTNAQLLTEGFDEPSVSAIIMARPTKSPVLFTQAVGRGLRAFPGKADCIVIDLGTHQHDICHIGSLVGKDLSEIKQGASLARAVAAAHEEIPDDDLRAGVKVVASSADILGRSLFVWRTAGSDRLILQASPSQRLFILPSEDGRFKVVLREAEQEDRTLNDGLSLGYAQGVAEDWVREQKLESFAGRDAKWRGQPASLKQRAILRGAGVEIPADLTRGQASELIDKHFAEERLRKPDAPWRAQPASEKQLAWLKAHRFHPKADITRGEAADIMTGFFDKNRKSEPAVK